MRNSIPSLLSSKRFSLRHFSRLQGISNIAGVVTMTFMLLMVSASVDAKDRSISGNLLNSNPDQLRSYPGFSQNNLDFDQKRKKRVIIRLKKRNLRNNGDEPRDNRRKFKKQRRIKAIAALKKDAKINQKRFIRFLENKGIKTNKKREKRIFRRLQKKLKDSSARSFWLSNCIALTATDKEIKEILKHPDVENITENVVLSLPPIISNGDYDSYDMDLWNHTIIGMDQVKNIGINGSNIRVGHLDTGIDPDNPELRDKLIAWAEFGPDGEKIQSIPHDTHYNGHGTHTASVIAGETTGVAPGVSILSALVLKQGYGTIEQALAGMEWVIDPDDDPNTDDGAQIVNMSWGANGVNEVLHEAIKNMRDANVLPVCAIGNHGYGTVLSPATSPDAIGVGAVDRNDDVTWFSGGGEVFWNDLYLIKPDITAPGLDIRGIGLDERYQTMSGTSFATPHIAGAAALLIEGYPELTLAQIKSFLYNTSLDNGNTGHDTRYGKGRLNISFAIDYLELYQGRIGANDLILKTIQEQPSYTIHQFKSFFSNGQKILPNETSETASSYQESIPIGLSDVNGDGFDDLVVEETTYFSYQTYYHKYQVYLSDNGKGLTKYPETWLSYSSNSPDPFNIIGVGDVNGDKRSDLIYLEELPAGYGTKYNIRVLLSQENQTFSDHPQLWASLISSHYDEYEFYIGDMNGDRKTDLILENKSRYNRYAPVLYKVGVSDGSEFTPMMHWLTNFYWHYSGESSLAFVKDANGDGFDDLIFIGQIYNSPGSVGIYISTSNGVSKFNHKQTWAQILLDDNSEVAGMGDINNDGAADLLINYDNNLGYSFDVWLSNKVNRFSISPSAWFKIDDIPYGSQVQFIGIANTGLGDWKH